jgi:hypothetical protein
MTSDTPIERAFEAAYYKHARTGYPLKAQVNFDTFCGRLCVDFVVRLPDRTIGFECDGKPFHEKFRDEIRDAILLGDKHLDVIYHFGGAELHYAPEFALLFVLEHEPELFQERTESVLHRQIETSDYRKQPDLIRRSAVHLHSGHQHWPFIFNKMKQLGITAIDDYVITPKNL